MTILLLMGVSRYLFNIKSVGNFDNEGFLEFSESLFLE